MDLVEPKRLSEGVAAVAFTETPVIQLMPRMSGSLGGARTASSANWPPLVIFETWAERSLSAVTKGLRSGISGVDWQAGKASIHRFVRDGSLNVYRYTITLEMPAGTDKYHATFSDYKGEASGGADWKVISPSRYPVPQYMEEGDTVVVKLYSDPSSGATLADYFRIIGRQRPVVQREGARDIYGLGEEDGAFDFFVAAPHLKVNGIAMETAALAKPVQGSSLSVSVPGLGRYSVSFRRNPRAGFEEAGEVSGNSLQFSVGGNIFRLDCSERIALLGSGTYNIFARRDPAGRGNPNQRGLSVIGVNSAHSN